MRHAPITSATATALVAVAPSCAWAQQPFDGHMYWRHSNMMWDGGGFGMIFGSLLMLVSLAVLIAAVAFVARRGGGPGNGSATPPGSRPLDILKERFARGEIDKEEFEDRRRVLGD